MTSRRNLAAALGGWSARHRKAAVLGWLLFVVLATVVGGAAGQRHLTDAQQGARDSAQAMQILDDAGITVPAGEMVLVHSDRATAADPAFRAAVESVRAGVQATGQVQNMRDPYATGLLSADRHSALIEFDMKGDPTTAADRVQPVLDTVAGVQKAHPDLTIGEYGSASGEKWANSTLGRDFSRAEWTAVPLALGILFVAFGALLAAVLPVILALTAFIAALGLLALVSHLSPVDPSSSSVMLLMGLAVGVDYCLFYLRREREERRAGRDREAALRIAAATSGRSVLISGMTVVVAMAGMYLSGMHIFEGFAGGTILVVATAVLGSVTVLPALLSILGDKIDFGRVRVPRTKRRAAHSATSPFSALSPSPSTRPHSPSPSPSTPPTAPLRSPSPRTSRAWNATLGKVLTRPRFFACAAVGFLILLALPALGMHTAKLSNDQQFPSNTPILRTYDQITAAFPNSPSPAVVVVKAADIQSPAVQQAISDLRQAALHTGELGDPTRGEPITVAVNKAANVAQIDVPLAGSGSDARSIHALNTLRALVPQTFDAVPGTEALVGGDLAFGIDFNNQLSSSIVPVFVFVLAITFILMLVAFRSTVIAGTAIVLNLLSVGATYGVMTAVFQHGWGASLIGTRPAGAIESWLPLFVFVVLFGLSMDYHVFVVSRIREAHDHGMTTRDAVAHGLKATAGTVTSAAVIMVAVFAVFGTLEMQDFKQLGVGLAVAVLLDATVVRVLLLPAVMTLLGDRNWTLPRWLSWLPRLEQGEDHALAAATAPAAVTEPPILV